MGRPSTGAWTVYECLRIELPYLLKQGYIKKGCIISFTLHWSDQRGNDTGSISCKSCYLGEDKYLQVWYTITKRNGEKSDYNYKIHLFEQASNLGKGKVLYFLCPQTFDKCRILYKAYDSPQFKSRQAYRNRLYYDCQQASKLNRYNENYWRLEAHIKKIKKEAGYGSRTYKGVLTKKAQRYNRLTLKQSRMDELRWTLGAPKALRGLIGKGLFP